MTTQTYPTYGNYIFIQTGTVALDYPQVTVDSSIITVDSSTVTVDE